MHYELDETWMPFSSLMLKHIYTVGAVVKAVAVDGQVVIHEQGVGDGPGRIERVVLRGDPGVDPGVEGVHQGIVAQGASLIDSGPEMSDVVGRGDGSVVGARLLHNVGNRGDLVSVVGIIAMADPSRTGVSQLFEAGVFV